MAPRYGQVVVGPPGAGKTTFCDGMQQYLKLLQRDVAVINLDPANEDNLPYEAVYDVCKEVVNLSSVMEKTGLGPNGGLVYCMEYMEEHVAEMLTEIRSRLKDKTYIVMDLPGQVELYTHSHCVQNLLQTMVKTWDLRLTAVQLIDSQYCTDAHKFLSAALLGTTTMLRLELPTVNVLSKVDLLTQYGGELPFSLEYFTDCYELERLVPFLDEKANETVDLSEDVDYVRAVQLRRQSQSFRKYARLHESIADVVGDFGLLSFMPLDISDAESVGRVLGRIDKANGYIFTGDSVPSDLFQCAVQSDMHSTAVADIQERISKADSIVDEWKR